MSRFVTQMIEVSHSCYCRHGSGFGKNAASCKGTHGVRQRTRTHEPEFTHSVDAKDLQ